MNVTWRLLVGDVREQLAKLPDESVQCCVTSPPYWGLRDYGVAEQIGMEQTHTAYIAALVTVFEHVKRVLRQDGTLWLNLGDCYANDGKWGGETGGKQSYLPDGDRRRVGREKRVTGLKPKDMVGIPWAVAFALRDAGWWLRRDIVWFKPNALPESVTDRPSSSHEYIFLLTKSSRYFYDAEAVAEPASEAMKAQMRAAYNGEGRKNYDAAGVQNPSDVKRRIIAGKSGNKERKFRKDHGGVEGSRSHQGFGVPWEGLTRNARSVWTFTTQPYPGAHFATFPEELPERCIKAGSRLGDIVLDPFAGSGTTGQVAIQLGRSFVGIEINPEYAKLARARVGNAAPLFAEAVP